MSDAQQPRRICSACGQQETLVNPHDGREPWYIHPDNEYARCEVEPPTARFEPSAEGPSA